MDKDVSLLPYLNAQHIVVQLPHLAHHSKELMEFAKHQLLHSAQRELAWTMQQKPLQPMLNVMVISRDALQKDWAVLQLDHLVRITQGQRMNVVNS